MSTQINFEVHLWQCTELYLQQHRATARLSDLNWREEILKVFEMFYSEEQKSYRDSFITV